MEGTIVSVHWVCADGGGFGWKCRECHFLRHLCDLRINNLTLQTVLVLKYVLNGYPEQFVYYGYANVSQSVAMMLSAVVLWISQSTSSEYEYNLTL
jgi:hypothetical protein